MKRCAFLLAAIAIAFALTTDATDPAAMRGAMAAVANEAATPSSGVAVRVQATQPKDGDRHGDQDDKQDGNHDSKQDGKQEGFFGPGFYGYGGGPYAGLGPWGAYPWRGPWGHRFW